VGWATQDQGRVYRRNWMLVAIDTQREEVLRAGAKAQKQMGALLTVHPGFHDESPMEILRVLEEADADLCRVVISHMSIVVGKENTRVELARKGCYLEWDLFAGMACFHNSPPRSTSQRSGKVEADHSDDRFGFS